MMTEFILSQSKNGKAVFAPNAFKKGEKIMDFKGPLFTYEQMPTPYDAVEDHYVQVGERLYMGPSGKYDDFLNHSCNPNSGLQIHNTNVTLVAIKNIKEGEEITWDYSTTMNEDGWELDCACESKNCRKRIRDFKHLPKRIQQKYIRLGVVPHYALAQKTNKHISQD